MKKYLKKRPVHLILGLLCFLPFSLFSQEISQNILVIHSYHQGLEWTDDVSLGIRDVLTEYSDNIEIYYEYLDTKRNPGEEYFQKISRFEQEKTQLAELQFEAIIVSDNNALRFMMETGADLYRDVPVIFCGVNNFSPSMLEGRENFTGIAETVDYESTLSVMKNLHPLAEKVLLVLDRTPTGEAINAELRPILERFSDTFEFEYYRDFSKGDIAEKIRTLEDDTLIYLLAYNQDSSQVFISYSDLIRLFHQNSPVPIYSSWDFYFGRGIAGGMITSAYKQGNLAGDMAVRILEGTPVSRMPVQYENTNQYMFDYNELHRFGISVRNLPEDALLVNHPESTFWENHWIFMLSLLLVLLISLVLLAVFFLKQKKEKMQIQTELETLGELIPICSHCKKIRDDSGYWDHIESFLRSRVNFTFSHGLCPGCIKELYPDISETVLSKQEKERKH